MVNIFQLIGDLLHLLSFIIIIYKIQRDAKCTGVSAKRDIPHSLLHSLYGSLLHFHLLLQHNNENN